MIYFVLDRAHQSVKIGFSDTPWSRFSQIQSATVSELVLVAVIEGGLTAEGVLHDRFERHHVRGEWFRWVGEIIEFVDGQRHIHRPRKTPKSPLEAWRRENGLTLVEVADKCGTCHASIQRIECGRQNPSLSLAVKLEDLTGIPARDFLLRRAA